ncbi:amyloid-beta A4 precursor protein-binding family A member 2 [Alosa sapidissima]|uniref:amyloid-beta A4 precursor protein-binding family A member 2 n=1 Tax=Alosa sapidissima TaxID=34773 RepID=UPI001C08E226|nr:amyloid-beta A4 precursor protein-binding family A member 2 [Alosa sapidissima]
MKPAKAHRKKLRAEGSETEPTPSQRHQRSSMETKQLHSSAMETKQLHSSAMETKQLHSNAMETKQLHSNAMETKQLHSNAMETKQLHSNAMETKLPNCSTMETAAPKAVPMHSESSPINARAPRRITDADADADWSSDEGPPPDDSPTHGHSMDEDSLSEYDNVGSEEEEGPDYDEDEELRTDADGMTYYVHCCPEDESYMEGMDCHEGADTGEGPSADRAPDRTTSASDTAASRAVSQAVQQDPEVCVYKHPEPLTEPTFVQAPMAEDEEDEEEEEEEEEDDYFPYEGEEAEEDQGGDRGGAGGRPGVRGEEGGEEEEEQCNRTEEQEQEPGGPYREPQSACTHTRDTHTRDAQPCSITPPYDSCTGESEEEGEEEEEAQACPARRVRAERRVAGRGCSPRAQSAGEERGADGHHHTSPQGTGQRRGSEGSRCHVERHSPSPCRRAELDRQHHTHTDPHMYAEDHTHNELHTHIQSHTHADPHMYAEDHTHVEYHTHINPHMYAEDHTHTECLTHTEDHTHTDHHTHAEGLYRGRADGGQGMRSRPYPRPRDAERRSWHIQGHEPRPEVTVDLADEVRRSLSMGRHMERSHDLRVTSDRPRGRSHHPRPVSLPLVLADDLERATANLPPRGRNRQRQSAHFPDRASPQHLYSQPNPEPTEPTEPNRTESNHKPPQPAKKNASFPSFVDVPGPCEPEDLVDGIIFAANYLGSTQLLSDRNPSKSVRMIQAQEAVEQVKSSNEDNQSLIEVDLFISTKAIKVLNADTQETIMDNALRTISYIADIGSVVVLMARRRMSQSASLDCTDPAGGAADSRKQYRMVCYVFESEDAQLIAQSIGQAFSMAYQEFLRSNGINPKDLSQKEYSDIINTQEMYNDDLIHFSNSENCKELHIEKLKGEMLGVVIVESGWGSILPTVILACMLNSGPAARSGRLSVGDQIMAVNDTSLVGLPLATCQSIIKGLKNQVQVKLSVVSCPPVTTVLIKRPDLQYQLGFSVQNGIICSLMRGGIAERGGVRVGHRIIEINGQSVVAMAHEKIVHALSVSVGEINMKTMPAVMFRLLTGQETPVYI